MTKFSYAVTGLRRRLHRHRLDVDAYRAELVRDQSPLSIQRLARAEARLEELEAVLEILGWQDVAYSAPPLPSRGA